MPCKNFLKKKFNITPYLYRPCCPETDLYKKKKMNEFTQHFGGSFCKFHIFENWSNHGVDRIFTEPTTDNTKESKWRRFMVLKK